MHTQVLTTGVLNNSKPASVCVRLLSQPDNNVIVSASVYPYQLKASPDTQGDLVAVGSDQSKFNMQLVLTLTFSKFNWDVKQCIQLVGVFDPGKTADYMTPLDLKVEFQCLYIYLCIYIYIYIYIYYY
jgi:hypothetical protein